MSDHPPSLPPASRPRRWLRLLLLLLTFSGGGVVGAVAGAAYMRERMRELLRHPEQVPDRVFPRVRAQLSLTDEQAEQVQAILRRRHAAMEDIRADSYPHQLTQFEAMRDEVAAILTPEQQQRWAQLWESVRERYLPPPPVRPRGPPDADFLFRRFDANHDGALSEDEVPWGMWRRLRLADTNGDGKVTWREYLDAKQKVGE